MARYAEIEKDDYDAARHIKEMCLLVKEIEEMCRLLENRRKSIDHFERMEQGQLEKMLRRNPQTS